MYFQYNGKHYKQLQGTEPWVPEAFHARFAVSVKSYEVTRASPLVSSADRVGLFVPRKKKPLVPRVTVPLWALQFLLL